MASPSGLLTDVVVLKQENTDLPPLESKGNLNGRDVIHIPASHKGYWKSTCCKVVNGLIVVVGVGLIIGGGILHGTEEEPMKKYSGMAMWVSGLTMIGVECCNGTLAFCDSVVNGCVAFR